MADITLSARFDTLEDAERAATEIRSLFDTTVDIRALSENQSRPASDHLDYPTFFAFPNLNFSSSTPYAGAFPIHAADLYGEDTESGAYSDHAYVVEARIDSGDEQRAAEIIEKYGAELI